MKNKIKIKKIEYDKALKVVEEYNRQKNKATKKSNRYGFLWWCENNNEHHRWVKAKDIDSACKKFLAKKPKKLAKIDYEVSNFPYYIDISNRKEFQEYL